MSDDNTDAEAYGRSPEPNPDLRSLDRLVGTWGMSGPPETKSSPALDACSSRRRPMAPFSATTATPLPVRAGERPGGGYEATTIRVEQAGRNAAP
jgi:hypothetical protein